MNSQSRRAGYAARKTTVPYDLRFIDAMIAHHEVAIYLMRHAKAKACCPELKDFARRAVGDRAREVVRLMEWRRQWFPGQPKSSNVTRMPGMSQAMEAMDTSRLRESQGREFDLAFVEMMMPHHENGVVLAQDGLGKAQREESRTLAQQSISARRQEVEMMSRWRVEWTLALSSVRQPAAEATIERPDTATKQVTLGPGYHVTRQPVPSYAIFGSVVAGFANY